MTCRAQRRKATVKSSRRLRSDPQGRAAVQRPIRTALATAIATAALGKPVEWTLIRLGTWDVPNERSSHVRPVPRAGGIAPLVGATTVALCEPSAHLPRRACLVIGGLASLGLIDDITAELSIRARLLVQLGSGSALPAAGVWDRLLSAFVTTGVVNVTNFMDGINGISGLTGLVWGANAIFESSDIWPESPSGHGDQHVFLGALVAGGSIGFLPYNLPRARIFLGDVGSYALGAAMATGILSRRTMGGRYRAAAPLLLYALDAAQALARRRLDGKPIGQPHRDHVYQQLVDAGVTHGGVAAFHAGLSAAIAYASRLPTTKKWVTTSTLCAIYLLSPPAIRATRPSAG